MGSSCAEMPGSRITISRDLESAESWFVSEPIPWVADSGESGAPTALATAANTVDLLDVKVWNFDNLTSMSICKSFGFIGRFLYCSDILEMIH